MVVERDTYFNIKTTKKILKSVHLNLEDYQDQERSVDILKIKTDDGIEVIVISDMMTYQAHAPLQTLMLPLRIVLLATEAKTIISCPHIYGIK
jgi:hypothetical protein